MSYERKMLTDVGNNVINIHITHKITNFVTDIIPLFMMMSPSKHFLHRAIDRYVHTEQYYKDMGGTGRQRAYVIQVVTDLQSRFAVLVVCAAL